MWTIDPMDPVADLDAVLEVDETSFVNPWTREMFRREFQNPHVSRIYVLRTPAEHVVGYCSSWLIFDEWHINNVAIRPEWRRRGAGRALLRAVLREAARLGARRATLEVRRSNEAARRLYEGLGFEVAGVRARYYSEPVEDALILWCDSLAS
jgi:ribosomal-protein-alanine N-acetyltransferase